MASSTYEVLQAVQTLRAGRVAAKERRRLNDIVYAYMLDGYPPVFSIAETLNRIVEKRLSIGRFGDSEFKLCRGEALPMQTAEAKLGERLRKVLLTPDKPNFASAILHPQTCNPSGRRRVMDIFADSYELMTKFVAVTRLDASFTDTDDITSVQRIWQDRKVVLIADAATKRQADGMKIFANAAEFNFIAAPKTQAFAEHPSLIQQAREYTGDALVLIDIGPTASVLAYELSCYFPNPIGKQLEEMKQAIDIGNLIRNLHKVMKK